jgi:maltose/moltooligosaccharide transporter
MIGLGGSIASALPWIMRNWFNLENTAAKGVIADNVKFSFYIGAFFFLIAVIYTVFTTKEYPPTDLGYKDKLKESRKGLGGGIKEITSAIIHMPPRMRIIALVQFFTWPGLFLMWFYYSVAVAYNIFGAKTDTDPAFGDGRDFAGLTLAYYNVVTFAFAFVLPFIADKLGRKLTHTICLLAGAAGLIAVAFVTSKNMLFVCMTGVGIAWASILSMPYAMLSGVLPANKIGIYMGVFNFFIVLPEIIASLGFKCIMNIILNNDRMLAVQTGGFLMILAALICFLFIKEKKLGKADEQATAEMEILEQRSV